MHAFDVLQVKYRYYETFNIKHENQPRFDSIDEVESMYLKRKIDKVKIKNLDINMRVSMHNIITYYKQKQFRK